MPYLLAEVYIFMDFHAEPIYGGFLLVIQSVLSQQCLIGSQNALVLKKHIHLMQFGIYEFSLHP